MKQLEVRFYSRQEMADELGLNKSDKNFTRKATSTLSNWGYDVNLIPRKGFEITRQPQTAKEKLNEIMVRYYGLDIQTDVYAFAVFFDLLLAEPSFQSQPWEEREEYLAEEIGYRVNERTLRKWGSILIKHGTIAKDKDKKSHWRTFYVNGKKVREEEEINDPERVAYWKEFWELKKQGCEDVSKILWDKYHTCHYSCCSLVCCAWDDNEREIYEEVMELVEEIAGMEPTEDIVESTTHIVEIPKAEKIDFPTENYIAKSFKTEPSNSKDKFVF